MSLIENTSDNISRLYATLPTLPIHKVRVEIDLEALRANYRAVKERAEKLSKGKAPKVISVVKADAYGHGADRVTEALLSEGCDFFAVSCIEEAISVRRVCDEAGSDAQILILGYTLPEEVHILAEKRISQAVFSPDYAAELDRAAQKSGSRISVHVKLDTGMNRLGFLSRNDGEIERTVADVEKLSAMAGLDVQGIFTHFAKADEIEGEDSLTDRQISRFSSVCAALEEKGCCPPIRHASNSAATVRFGGLGFDYVRAGIILYGAKPSDDTDAEFLRPVMKLKTVVAHIHKLTKGEKVSYGGTFRAEKEMTVATLPIGYADGFIRAYGGALVTVETANGEFKAPIIGRICMDQCMIDVSGIDCAIGDPVRVFGGEPQELYDLAAQAGTIDYECLCLVSARVPRVYKN